MERAGLMPLFLLCAVFLAASCSSAPLVRTEPLHWDKVLALQGMDLEWLPDGSGILVEGRWILNPSEASWSDLGYQAPRQKRALSRRGNRIALIETSPHQNEAATLQIGTVGEELSTPLVVPLWHKPEPGEELPPRETLEHALAWLNQDQLYVGQHMPRKRKRANACFVLDVRDMAWKKPETCLVGRHTRTEWMTSGPQRWFLLLSSRRGKAAMNLTRWASTSRIMPPGVPRLGILPAGIVLVSFDEHEIEMQLSTPCDLKDEGSSCDIEDGEPWKLYGWALAGGPMVSLREDLPPWAQPSPQRDRFVWPRGDQVCVGDLDDPEKQECFRLPGRPPS